MSAVDYYVALAFFLLVMLLGMAFSRSGKNMRGFFAAGGNVPWWVSGLSLFMSFFSVGTFVVWGSIAYSSGVVAISIQTTMAFAGFIIGFYIAPAWNKTKILTVAEFITLRLGRSIQKLYSFSFLFINLFTAGAFLYPVGKIIEVSAGVPLESAIVALGILIIAYTAIGGLWAVLITDVLQFVVLSAAVVLLIPLALGEVGGLSGFFNNLPEGFLALHDEQYGGMFLVAFLVYNALFIGGNWAYVQRYTSVSGTDNAKKVGLMFGSLYLIAPVIWMLPPMIYRVMNPDLTGTQSEEAYLLISKLVLPEGLLGLMLGAMVFATASSVNTTLNIAAGVLTNDIIKPLKPALSSASLMQVARFSTFSFGVLAIFIALSVKSMGGIVEVVLSVAALTGAPLYLPPIWALFSKRQTGKSVFLTTLISLIVNAFFKFVSPELFDFSLNRTAEMALGVILPILILLTSELYFKYTGIANPQYEYYQRKLKEKTEETIRPKPESNESNEFAFKILYIGIVAIGLLILGLGLFTDKANLETMTVGSVILAIPTLLILRHVQNNKNSQS